MYSFLWNYYETKKIHKRQFNKVTAVAAEIYLHTCRPINSEETKFSFLLRISNFCNLCVWKINNDC